MGIAEDVSKGQITPLQIQKYTAKEWIDTVQLKLYASPFRVILLLSITLSAIFLQVINSSSMLFVLAFFKKLIRWGRSFTK